MTEEVCCYDGKIGSTDDFPLLPVENEDMKSSPKSMGLCCTQWAWNSYFFSVFYKIDPGP